MSLIHAILNLTALLLWLNWRTARLARVVPEPGRSLLSSVKRTDAPPGNGTEYGVALIALLVVRGLFYWHIGPAVAWTPRLDLAAIMIPFRSDAPERMLVFSFLSFGGLLAGFYICLLLLSVVNRHASDSWQRLVRLHLGWLEGLPAAVKLLLPMAAGAVLWSISAPILAQVGVIPGTRSAAYLWQESALFGLATYLVWQYLIVGVLALYFVNCYIYFGGHEVWRFVDNTGRNLLRPLRWLPMRVGKVDLLPLLAIALAVGVARGVAVSLPYLYQRLPL